MANGILPGRTLGPLAQLSFTIARRSNVKSALHRQGAFSSAKQAEEPGRRYLRRARLVRAFENRGLEFRDDSQAAALGANGSGKSTLLRLPAGRYEPTSGRILIGGVDLHQMHPRDLRRGVGYLWQEMRLFAGSLRDNLQKWVKGCRSASGNRSAGRGCGCKTRWWRCWMSRRRRWIRHV